MNKIKNILILIRPQQWIKNGFVFLPLFFSGSLLIESKFSLALVAFFSFSLAASSVYCINDIKDFESDSKHPQKSKRPIASGSLSKFSGYIIMTLLIILSFCIEFFWGGVFWWKTLIIIFAYFLMNLAYSYKLKQIAIIDVFIVAFGFILRIIAGGLSTNTILSHWIILMTFLLALFLAFAKRRDDVLFYNNSGIKMRKNIIRFNLEFLNAAMIIVSTMTLVCYIMYTVSEEVITYFNSNYLYITSIFVLLGIMRYLQLIFVDNISGDPTKILIKDRFIQFAITAWIISFFLIIYF